MRTFTVERNHDETGISGTGIVMEGVEFSNGKVVICWKSDPYSIVHWDTFDDMKKICIDGHPTNDTVVRWSDGEVFWQNGPEGLRGTGDVHGVEVEAGSSHTRA